MKNFIKKFGVLVLVGTTAIGVLAFAIAYNITHVSVDIESAIDIAIVTKVAIDYDYDYFYIKTEYLKKDELATYYHTDYICFDDFHTYYSLEYITAVNENEILQIVEVAK